MDTKRVHRDGAFLRVADVLASQILAQSLVGVSGIDHYDVRTLFVQLAHNRVHVEGFPGTARSEGKKVRVVRQLLSAFLAGDVDGDRHSLAVSVIDFHRGVFAVLHTFLVHQAHRRVR